MLNVEERRKPNWEYLQTKSVALSFSGGMDSTAVLLLAVQNGINITALSTWGETEHPESRWYRTAICDKLSVSLIEAAVPDSYQYFLECINSCKDYLSAFNKFYDRQHHTPLKKMLFEDKFSSYLVGYRADEHQWQMDENAFAPIFYWSKLEVKNFLEVNNIPLHPCYTQTEFLSTPIRESSWIDIEKYGLFHLADSGEVHRDIIITMKWLKIYYPKLFELVLVSFDFLKKELEINGN
jgi:3'-phosphoadenosine 5'-phosphosulfate sulfotransferase (PAPS reductase)/FAD synthetase